MKSVTPWFILFILVSVTGCATVISKDLLQQADKNLTFQSVHENPDGYKQAVVVWGGVIISTKNLKDGTLVEVLQKPLRFGHEPSGGDNSGGRFLAFYDGYLDSAVYAAGREVTVAGEVVGRRVQRIDELDYVYPYLTIKELHLWAERSKDVLIYHDYPYMRWRHHRYHYPWW